MSMADPLVSIVTPVLNAHRFVEGALESVATQSYPQLEHVIVDAGSTDGTLEIVERYAARFPGRIRYISEPDCGPGDGWNKGLKLARGDIFGCIGADDLCEPGAVAAVVDFFKSTPGASFVNGECRRLREDGTTVIQRTEPFDFREYVNTSRHIATPSAYYRREAMERIGWLDSSGDDFDVMIRIAQNFEMHRLERVLSTLRLHRGSAFDAVDPRKRQLALRETYKVSRNYGGCTLSPIAVNYYYFSLLVALRLDPDARSARWIARHGRRLTAWM